MPLTTLQNDFAGPRERYQFRSFPARYRHQDCHREISALVAKSYNRPDGNSLFEYGRIMPTALLTGRCGKRFEMNPGSDDGT